MHHMGNTARGNMGMGDDELGMPVDAAKLEKATPFDRAFTPGTAMTEANQPQPAASSAL